ncbi:MAG: ABC transporter permease [Solirubrobacteraceae bacterium]|jgi:ABC-2 type transport system permease protein
MSARALRRDLSLAGWQVLYEQRAFWRNRAGSFFVFLMPIIFLVLFAAIFQNQTIAIGHGRSITYVTFFVPGILAYGVIATTFVNMAIGTSVLRDEGVLKRVAGTPLPGWVFVAGRIGSTLCVTAVMTILELLIGRYAYNAHVRIETLPGLVVTLALGSAAFTTLGVGIVRYISNAESAPAVANAAILPLTFVSGIWFHFKLPAALSDIAKVFPIRALAHGLQYAFNPFTAGAGFERTDLLTLAAWLVVGVIAMARFLRAPYRA